MAGNACVLGEGTVTDISGQFWTTGIFPGLLAETLVGVTVTVALASCTAH